MNSARISYEGNTRKRGRGRERKEDKFARGFGGLLANIDPRRAGMKAGSGETHGSEITLRMPFTPSVIVFVNVASEIRSTAAASVENGWWNAGITIRVCVIQIVRHNYY